MNSEKVALKIERRTLIAGLLANQLGMAASIRFFTMFNAPFARITFILLGVQAATTLSLIGTAVRVLLGGFESEIRDAHRTEPFRYSVYALV